MGRFFLPLAILVGAGAVAAFCVLAESYTQFVIALIALTVIVGVGLNILLGLAGQVSLGHVGFYAIGAYVEGILILKGWDFFAALPLAGRPLEAFALITLGFTRLSAPAGGVGPVKRMILSADLTAARRGMSNLLNLSTGSVRNEIESLARKLNVAV